MASLQQRRDFLVSSFKVSSGFVLGVTIPGLTFSATNETADFAPNAWLRLDTNGTTTVMINRCEMGQGVTTALPMILADEMDADWNKVRFEIAPAEDVYKTLILEVPRVLSQITGASLSVAQGWEPLRKAGATAREMLITAAANRWSVAPSSCIAESGEVIHPPSRRHLSFGELAQDASTLPVPENPRLKNPSEFSLIGSSQPRLDNLAKIKGAAQFGIDVRLAGMKFASVIRCPVIGGKVRSVGTFDGQNTDSAQLVELHEISSDGKLGAVIGLAIVADNHWQAQQALNQLEVEWDLGPNADLNSSDIKDEYARLALEDGITVLQRGEHLSRESLQRNQVEAVYETPFLAHAAMEPMNATAYVQADRCEIWAPTQAQTDSQHIASILTGLRNDQIKIHTSFLGGGFGRRSETDFIADAVQISQAVGKPVNVLWSREQDIKHDFYRPYSYHKITGTLDGDGLPFSWNHRIVSPSIMSRSMPEFVVGGVDPTSVEGAIMSLPETFPPNFPIRPPQAVANYDIQNIAIDYVLAPSRVPVGVWRSVGHSINGFVSESFLDELAAEGGLDPVTLRRYLLRNLPRPLHVLDRVVNEIDWFSPLPDNKARGVASHSSFDSYVTVAVELSGEGSTSTRVERIVCAIDCGTVINPDIVSAQIEGAIVFGLTAATKDAISVKNGEVEQSNFYDFRLLRINETPSIDVHIVSSDESPSGVGEPGVPPVAPALCNAYFQLTGIRHRTLPLDFIGAPQETTRYA